MFKALGRKKMKKKKMAFGLLVAFCMSLGFLAFSSAEDNPPPKCEKCYRGPDGKIKCEAVECPKK